jgi:hypothetical protein
MDQERPSLGASGPRHSKLREKPRLIGGFRQRGGMQPRKTKRAAKPAAALLARKMSLQFNLSEVPSC